MTQLFTMTVYCKSDV